MSFQDGGYSPYVTESQLVRIESNLRTLARHEVKADAVVQPSPPLNGLTGAFDRMAFGQIAVALQGNNVKNKIFALQQLLDLVKVPKNIPLVLRNTQTVFGEGTATLTVTEEILNESIQHAERVALDIERRHQTEEDALRLGTNRTQAILGLLNGQSDDTANMSLPGPQSEVVYRPAFNCGPRYPGELVQDVLDTFVELDVTCRQLASEIFQIIVTNPLGRDFACKNDFYSHVERLVSDVDSLTRWNAFRIVACLVQNRPYAERLLNTRNLLRTVLIGCSDRSPSIQVEALKVLNSILKNHRILADVSCVVDPTDAAHASLSLEALTTSSGLCVAQGLLSSSVDLKGTMIVKVLATLLGGNSAGQVFRTPAREALPSGSPTPSDTVVETPDASKKDQQLTIDNLHVEPSLDPEVKSAALQCVVALCLTQAGRRLCSDLGMLPSLSENLQNDNVAVREGAATALAALVSSWLPARAAATALGLLEQTWDRRTDPSPAVAAGCLQAFTAMAESPAAAQLLPLIHKPAVIEELGYLVESHPSLLVRRSAQSAFKLLTSEL